MYANGEGVPQDYVRAHMWFNLSAAQGISTCCDTQRQHCNAHDPRANRGSPEAGA